MCIRDRLMGNLLFPDGRTLSQELVHNLGALMSKAALLYQNLDTSPAPLSIKIPVSYTHLDVYKRQTISGLLPKKTGFQSTRSATLPFSTDPTYWEIPWVTAGLMVYFAI